MKIKGAVLRESNKPYTFEDLELDPPKENEEIQIEEPAVDGICGVY
jgi:mycofactocin precursor